MNNPLEAAHRLINKFGYVVTSYTNQQNIGYIEKNLWGSNLGYDFRIFDVATQEELYDQIKCVIDLIDEDVNLEKELIKFPYIYKLLND